jgi:hypothetical protein
MVRRLLFYWQALFPVIHHPRGITVAFTQVWDRVQHIFLGNVVYAHHYVYADLSKVNTDLQNAFAYQVDLRVGGGDLAHARKEPLSNGGLGTGNIGTLGSVNGEVDDWGATTAGGADIGGNWNPSAASVHLLVVSKGDVAASLSALAGLVPVAGPIIKGIASFLGGKAKLTIAHDNIIIPIHRDAQGYIIAINTTPVPQVVVV